MFAYQSDIEGDMIKLLGDWASDCYKRYIDVSIDKRYDSMKAFVEVLNRSVAVNSHAGGGKYTGVNKRMYGNGY